MSKGIVLFGINNDTVDYIQLAVMAASFIKKNMPGTDICLITDIHSKSYHDGKGRWPLNKLFSDIVLLPDSNEEKFKNQRAYRDTRYHVIKDKFRNESRSSVYDLSPYDETILLDSDFLVCNDVLKHVWGSKEDIAINANASGLWHAALGGDEYRLNNFGIRMYWATVVYFKKGEKAKLLFDLVQHVKENWEFYKLSYGFPGSLFRNDYAFSIAIHILNGGQAEGDFVADLPEDTILTALDFDQFFRINSPTDISFFVNNLREDWKFKVSRLKNQNVHCINKLSLLNNMERIMEVVS